MYIYIYTIFHNHDDSKIIEPHILTQSVSNYYVYRDNNELGAQSIGNNVTLVKFIYVAWYVIRFFFQMPI